MYDISEFSEMFDLYGDTPLLTRKVSKGNGQAESAPGSRPHGGEPTDVDARLAAMQWQGAGDTAIHTTWKDCMGALLREGMPAGDVIKTLLEATEKNCQDDPAKDKWPKKLTDLLAWYLKYEPDFVLCLSREDQATWNEAVRNNKRPLLVWRSDKGLHLRVYDEKEEAKPKKPEINIDYDAILGGKKAKEPHDEPKQSEGEKKEKTYRFKLINFWDMRPGLNERPYLIDELIPTEGLVVVWGPPKCLKSFLALDAMMHVVMGWEYHDRAVQKGPVVYCAFEGGYGFTKRIEALRRHYGLDPDVRAPLPVLSGMANLINDHRLLTKEIGEQIKRDFGAAPIAVVLDTLARSMQGSESKDTDMAAYIAAATAIRDAFKCVVIIIHHCGYDDSRMRGHSGLPAAIDASLAVVREGDVATMTVEYMKDGPEGTCVTVRSKPVVVGQDANGKELTSLVLERFDGSVSAPKGPRPWPQSLKVFHKALVDTILACGFDHKITAGPTVKAADLEHVRAAFYKTYLAVSDEDTDADQQQDSKRKAFARAVETAQAKGFIGALADGKRRIVWLVSPFEGGYAI
jgi:AAA domain